MLQLIFIFFNNRIINSYKINYKFILIFIIIFNYYLSLISHIKINNYYKARIKYIKSLNRTYNESNLIYLSSNWL